MDPDPTWPQIRDWRKQQRAGLIARRTAVPQETLRQWNATMTGLLADGFAMLAGMTIGFCWPFKNEFDARFAIRRLRDHGATAALPAVVAKAQPLQFRKWWPGAPMTPGVYDIPVPDGTDVVTPDAAIVPMNGFDGQGYRLGYGGGYFDRTLAAAAPRPLSIGTSFEFARLATIHPQAHDIAMDFIVTEAGIYRAGGATLRPLDAAQCAQEVKLVLESRGLPRRGASSSVSPAVASVARGAEGYSSPACYAHEIAPDYFGESPGMSTEELIPLLNRLLEAERAGAKVLAEFLNEYPRDTPAWKQLAKVQRDEAENCAILIDLIRRANGTASAATGDFLGRALAVEGKVARLKFLNRGQQWVARKISEALPNIEQGYMRDALYAMQESHLLNIEACDALVETLEA